MADTWDIQHDVDELLGMPRRERPQQNGVERAENDGVGSDACS
jgi:hypothetical protein